MVIEAAFFQGDDGRVGFPDFSVYGDQLADDTESADDTHACFVSTSS